MSAEESAQSGVHFPGVGSNFMGSSSTTQSKCLPGSSSLPRSMRPRAALCARINSKYGEWQPGHSGAGLSQRASEPHHAWNPGRGPSLGCGYLLPSPARLVVQWCLSCHSGVGAHEGTGPDSCLDRVGRFLLPCPAPALHTGLAFPPRSSVSHLPGVTGSLSRVQVSF